VFLDPDGSAGEALSEDLDDFRRSNGDPRERTVGRSFEEGGGRVRSGGDEPRELAEPLPSP
jgi:hypothetical protein